MKGEFLLGVLPLYHKQKVCNLIFSDYKFNYTRRETP